MKQWVFILLIGAVMTTYNTGNAVGSTDARDLSDNAKNFDRLSAGAEMEYPDRLGVPRKSWAGMEQQVADFMAAQGWEAVTIPYAAGAIIERPTQLVERAGELYRVQLQSYLPLTLSGEWAIDAPKLVAIGNEALRSALANGTSSLVDSEVVGRGSSNVSADLAKLEAHVAVEPTPLDAPYSAKGDGVTSDTAAFAAFEAAVEGRVVDLGGKSYVVATVPKSNAYVNGQFVVGGFNRPALPFNTFMSPAPKYHAFGGQLRKLKEQLANPLNQYVGIAFIGDSITWGSGASGTGGSPDRDGTLSDPRSTYGAPSFVNQVKRYIRDNYKSGDGLAESVTNWPGSSAGESTVLYQNRELLYPRYGQFTVAKISASQDPADLSTNNSPTGMILSLNNTADGAQYGHSIVFTFTGSKFSLGIRTSTGGATDGYYDVLINGALHATVNARPGFNGLVDDNLNYDQRITTEFPYVKDATITIRTNRNGLTGQRLLSVTGLHIDRQVRIVNNGIIGATTVSYLEKNMAGNTSGDGTAVVGADQFVFCQLGTNDRAWTTGRPRGSNQFYVNLKALLANASLTGKEVILMAANPAANEDPTVYPFHMQEVRNIIYRTAKELSLDMIDNYTIFQGLNNSVYTDDGLHPNDFGHSLIARNIINSLESE